MKILRLIFATAAGVLLLSSATAHAVPFTYELEFETTGQSLWDTGTAATLNKNTFLGAAWQDQSASLDLIAGDEDVNVPNPLRIAYNAAFGACRGLGFSSSACINGQSARIPVPRLGSRPSVRSCGKFAVACKIAQGADVLKRAAYDLAFGACKRLGNSSSTCRNGQSGRLPVIALGTAPPQFLEVDTRTGVAVEGTSDGRVGLEFGIEIGSGSVDATVSYQATLDIPHTSGLDKADAISFNPNSVLAGTNTLNTEFADLALSADAIFELSGSVTGEACIIAAGCKTGSTPFDIDATAPILSFNEDGEGGILLLGQKPSVFGFPDEANGFPFTIDAGVSGLVSATLHLPQPDASGGLDTATGTLTASGQDDLVDLNVDVDAAVSLAVSGGVTTNAFGFSVPIGNIGSVGYDIIDVNIGPSIDLLQDFELDPTLFVQLVFDKAVMVAGELVTELISAWDLLPDIFFLDDVTAVTPTFFLDAELRNETLLDFDFDFLIDLLQINFDLLGFERQFGIGNVLDQGVDLFQSPNLFENLFSLQGFDLQIGESFIVDFLAGSTAPDDVAAKSAKNPIEKVALASVPEPGAFFLILVGLCGLHLIRRRPALSGKFSKLGRKALPLAICGLILQTTTAKAADNNDKFAMKGAGFLPCQVFMKARENRSNTYYMIGGWVEGYVSAHNRYASDTYDIMSFESLELLLNVIQNHCEANPGHRLHAVVNSIVVSLQPDRLRRESTRVRIADGVRKGTLRRETIRRVQSKLSERGLYKGKVDGRFTDKTKSALIAFQSDLEFETTGFPDQTTLWKLFRH